MSSSAIAHKLSTSPAIPMAAFEIGALLSAIGVATPFFVLGWLTTNQAVVITFAPLLGLDMSCLLGSAPGSIFSIA